MKTQFKKIEDLVIEVNSLSDEVVATNDEQIDYHKGDRFYSELDNKIHKATGWHSYYYYDENKKAHADFLCYKIIATSNNEKYSKLPLLTAFDLVKK